MLTAERNDLLTRIGPGTPAGDLLRRFWQPICAEAELTTNVTRKRVRILGEDLVAYRDKSGTYGLIEEHCAHRGASLFYGFLEDDGIRCPYHGVKYGHQGECLEIPFEPKDSPTKSELRMRSYPMEALGGLLFAYMGPDPAPLLPRWDILVREDGSKKVSVLPIVECNWLQIMENSADTAHTFYLHAHMMAEHGKPEQGAYYYRPIEKMDFELINEKNWAGLRKARTYGGDNPEKESGHPILFPNALLSPERNRLCLHYRVPVDDTHTRIFRYEFRKGDGRSVSPVPVEYVPPFKTPEGDYILDVNFAGQDAMAYESQGPIADRTREHLLTADRGVALFRKMLLEQIQAVQHGKDPIGLVRDPKLNERIDIDVSSGQERLAKETGVVY